MNDIMIEQFTRTAVRLMPRFLMGLLIFFLSWIAAIGLQKTVAWLCRNFEEGRRDMFLFFSRIAEWGIIIVGAIVALGRMGINVSALIAGLGLTGFAFGFALKDILSNLLAGILTLIYKPFQVHDHISIMIPGLSGNLEGTVVKIDLRYTTLQSQGKIVLVPNSILFSNALVKSADKTQD